ncbi:TIGR04211 family SH3 domain-containing protein [Dissulfurirhabdus thermomarina]|uniref:TIGR04211 family SH3 domain-containing protein n=1 Tax=Dissulfurirhabdus thermomarina TaxID=1765737 RepID=A0A6N9TKW8_DISTH|nr:TIGR04211 family SH3 domain-containing protein [Dissulfurirhabdus thermomarina]NDY41922.1 TIGR04211 family SH3 domain-containing protein [Dissulfurirhabdus thermomarina]NMX23108.1 TIGR04211 family SH3 domain-containing protein [Dissulfurirhabdus thermomarina]
MGPSPSFRRRSAVPVDLVLIVLLAASLAAAALPGAAAAEPTEANATTRHYVAPAIEVPLRTGQDTTYRIIALVPNGTPVEVLEEGDKWVRVRLPSGKEGWMPSRFVTTERPLRDVLTEVERERDRLGRRLKEERTLNAALKEELAKARKALAEAEKARDQAQKAYKTLAEDAKDVVALKNAYDESQSEVQKLRQRVAILEQKNQQLERDRFVSYFLAGGGVLLVGWLLGALGGRRKRRSRLEL